MVIKIALWRISTFLIFHWRGYDKGRLRTPGRIEGLSHITFISSDSSLRCTWHKHQEIPFVVVDWLIDWLMGTFSSFLVFFSSPKTATCLDFFPSYEVAGMTWRSGPVTEPSTLSTMPLHSVISKVFEPSLPLWKKTGKEREERESVRTKKKSIGFHYLVGQCHWPVNDPATVPAQGWDEPPVNRHWQEENMLTATRNKSEHRFALQALVRGGGVRGHQTARGQARAERGAQYSGLWPGFHPLVWMPHSPSQTLLSSHQLFTSGFTKGNPGALIVAKRNSSPSLVATNSRSLFRSFSFYPFPTPCPTK